MYQFLFTCHLPYSLISKRVLNIPDSFKHRRGLAIDPRFISLHQSYFSSLSCVCDTHECKFTMATRIPAPVDLGHGFAWVIRKYIEFGISKATFVIPDVYLKLLVSSSAPLQMFKIVATTSGSYSTVYLWDYFCKVR